MLPLSLFLFQGCDATAKQRVMNKQGEFSCPRGKLRNARLLDAICPRRTGAITAILMLALFFQNVGAHSHGGDEEEHEEEHMSTEYTLDLRIGHLFVVLISSLIGIMVPIFAIRQTGQKLSYMMMAFSGGA